MLRSLKSILFIFMVLFMVVNLRRNRMAPMSEISTLPRKYRVLLKVCFQVTEWNR